MLASRATGEAVDGLEFQRVRKEVLAAERLRPLLPRFVFTCVTPNEWWSFIKPKFGTYQQRHEFIAAEFERVVEVLDPSRAAPHQGEAEAALARVDSEHVRDAWRRAIERRGHDAEGALTAARTLLETVCKHILDKRSVAYPANAELPAQYSIVARQLRLAPAKESERLFRQVLGSCQQVVEGIGAMRNRFGDAHGKGRDAARVDPRFAELAVNLAGSMALFLVASHDASGDGELDAPPFG